MPTVGSTLLWAARILCMLPSAIASSTSECQNFFSEFSSDETMGWWLQEESSWSRSSWTGVPDAQEEALLQLFRTSSSESLQSDEVPDEDPDPDDVTAGVNYALEDQHSSCVATVFSSKLTHVPSCCCQDAESGVVWPGGNAMLCCVNSGGGSYVVAAHEFGADGRCFDGASSTASECGSWEITCGSNGVEEIQLNDADLGDHESSTIPNEIRELTFVRKLEMSNNGWTAITATLEEMESLQILDLSDNDIEMSAASLFSILENANPPNAPRSTLERIELQDNDIYGELPAFGVRMDHLVYLDLEGNRLEGHLPDNTFAHLDRLTHLSLSNNRDLGGLIHEDFRHMAQMRELSISSTDLGGELFDFSSMAGSLTRLDAHDCRFVGSIPESIGQCTLLRYLDLHGSHLEGPLPSSMSNLNLLEVVRLGDNELSGPLPAGIFAGSVVLQELDLSQNRLEGSVTNMLQSIADDTLDFSILNLEGNSLEGQLPANLGDLGNMRQFNIASNSLSGELPESIDSLVRVTTFDIHDNEFSGEVPNFGCDETCTLRIATIDISENRFTGDGIPGIGRMCRLMTITAHDNLFTGIGTLPPSVTSVDFDRNRIGVSAETLGLTADHCELQRLQLEHNQITGDIASIASLPSLQIFKAGHNQISNGFPDCHRVGLALGLTFSSQDL
eukprot:SAG31_NODE_4782_length_2958_cov_1.792585_2_plen_674_part_01